MADRIIGWFFLGLLALLLLLLLVPVVVYVDYSDSAFSLSVRVLLVKLRIFPPRKQRAGRKTKKAESDKKPKKEAEEKPKRTFEENIALIKRIAASAGAAMRLILKGLFIRDISLTLPVSGGDAAEVALNFGRVQGIIGGARAVLDNILHMHYKRLVLLPDFTGQHGSTLSFSCKVIASPVIMVVAGLWGLRTFLFYKPAKYTRAEYVQSQKGS